jgi:nitroimidazol reductase NimA-like FMN-containing flavoprotein (pyridoxamine 5'-phosphate oxidase superfamily)
MSHEPAAPTAIATPAVGRRLVELDWAEAMGLLAGVEFGRIVFTAHALPAIRPVNHLVDHGEIIIRSHLGGAVSDAVDRAGVVVAYEADEIDPRRRLGWSVVVTGYARPVTDPGEAARFEAALMPWVDNTLDTVVRIRPEIVTGFRLVEAG